jgi:hypothetical protein
MMKDRFDMNPSRTRLFGIAAALSTIAIAAPVSTAGAATVHRTVDTVAAVSGGPTAVALPVTDRDSGHGPAITGSTYITTAPTTFVNDNNQVSDGNTSLGNQTAA